MFYVCGNMMSSSFMTVMGLLVIAVQCAVHRILGPQICGEEIEEDILFSNIVTL